MTASAWREKRAKLLPSAVTVAPNRYGLPGSVFNYLNKGRYNKKVQLMWKYWMKITFYKNEDLDIGQFKIFDRKNIKQIAYEKSKSESGKNGRGNKNSNK
jgi:hypothetical protein